MSTNKIDEMTEREAKDLLNDIFNIFNIGGKVKTPSTLLTNIKNAKRRSACLSRIERHLTVTEVDDDGEEYEDELLNWGENPEQYIKTFKRVTSD